jgi:RNA polymerase sigma-70 factor (ECF subfamily)
VTDAAVSDAFVSDAELLAASADGDERAFTVLVHRHIRAATLLAAQWVGDQDEAEDIVQDAFIIVHREARRFDAARPLAPWLFGIVRKLASNRVARAVRRSRLLALWHRDTGIGQQSSATFDDPAHEALADAIRTLPPMQRACFELVVLRGLSPRDVAAMHGIAESTVRQHVFRARNTLKSELT